MSIKINYLDFEQSIAELDGKIEALRAANNDNDNIDISKELEALDKKNKKLSEDIYGNLTAWQISQIARHTQRPYTLDYIQNIFTDFEELHGDRAFADDPAIVGGLARFEGQPVMVIGHQKGRDVKERQYRNFGMPKPEGYRKALRLYRLAEKFNIPIITLIDTPGAYPGIGAEERGQSEAIGRNLYVMAELKTPIIGVVIGEGGSGGALALGVVDQLLMLQYSTYSVISPEGCASILYKSAEKASIAAESLAITAERLKVLGLIDRIVSEPFGGAHRAPEVMMESLKTAIHEELVKLKTKSIKSLLVTRYERLMGYGKFKDVVEKNKQATLSSSLVLDQVSEFVQLYCTAESLLLLGFSGGLDSSVLLHALVTLQQSKTTLRPFKLHAMHVHHGISQHADDWARCCVAQCESYKVPLEVVRIKVNQLSDLGLEGEARQLRYQALSAYQFGGISPHFIVTAHHQDDQAETLMLQLMRGAGVKGLASMALMDCERRLLRPLLHVSREALIAYANLHQIAWCDDESNNNLQYTRNFIRHSMLPLMKNRVPAIHKILARTASHMAEANSLLDDLARLDANMSVETQALNLDDLVHLTHARLKNVMRWWLAQHAVQMPSSEQLEEMLQQLMHAKLEANIKINLDNKIIRRYQQRVYVCSSETNETEIAEEFEIYWQGQSHLILPDNSQLLFNQVKGFGLAMDGKNTELIIRLRRGGEQFKPDAKRPMRSLKYLLQAAKVPPWQRGNLPLIYWQNRLVYIPFVGYAHDLQANQEEIGLEITWKP